MQPLVKTASPCILSTQALFISYEETDLLNSPSLFDHRISTWTVTYPYNRYAKSFLDVLDISSAIGRKLFISLALVYWRLPAW